MAVVDSGDYAISATIVAIFMEWVCVFIHKEVLFFYCCYLGEEKAEDKEWKQC